MPTERDMFDQRNQQFSTILVATTIMLSSLICVLAQGVLPDSPQLGSFIYYLYSISTSVSVGFLFTCTVICIEVMWRASRFMYRRNKYHNGYLANAIKKTKEMMSAIRGVKKKTDTSNSSSDPKSKRFGSNTRNDHSKNHNKSNSNSSNNNKDDYHADDDNSNNNNNNSNINISIKRGMSKKTNSVHCRDFSEMSEADVQREFLRWIGVRVEEGRIDRLSCFSCWIPFFT